MKSPQDYLLIAKQDEVKLQGKLKVFFGMSPGVGKTYSMLKEAHQLQEEGFSVLVGIVETHGRKETAELVSGLVSLPFKKIIYKDKEWNELDVETILRKRPDYVLVDELAHTNIPGSLHKKRYQDVFEILEAGINVYTTVNVQHLESQVDSVEKTLKSQVQETLPDSIMERADELVLIDIVPDELLKRLEEGKVYVPEKVPLARENFFKKENLAYLRELSLSYTAHYVEKRLPSGKERILVVISADPNCKTLLRHAKKLSLERNGDIIAIFIEPEENLTTFQKNLIRSHIRLAKELGAEVVYSYESDPAVGIISAVKEKQIHRVVIANDLNLHYIFPFFKKKLPVRLMEALPGCELIVLSSPPKVAKKDKVNLIQLLIPSSQFRSYASVLTATFTLTFINLFLYNFIGYWPISILYLFFVALTGIFYTRGPVLLSAFLSAMFWNYLFIPPRFTFYISKLEDLLMFFVFIFVALVNGSLTAKLKRNELKLRSREEKLSILYELTGALSKTSFHKNILEIGDLFFQKVFPFPVKMHLFHDNKLEPVILDPKELAVAHWVIKNGKPAGKFTETLPLAESSFYPLISPGGTAGVLNVRSDKEPTLEQEVLLNTIANQVSIALERESLSEEAKKTYLLKESEKLYNLLFNSLSHELKTPLTSIRGSASALMDPEIENDPLARKSLIEEIQESALVLNLLLGNLLDISRIESGHLSLTKDKVYPNEIITDVVGYLGRMKGNHKIIVNITGKERPLFLDRSLFGHGLFNLIYNACLYTPAYSHIWISVDVKDDGQSVWIVEDNGKGLPEDPSTVFKKFYRGEFTGKIGTGLGLAITKSIIELHGGNIIAENRKEGGARFAIELPSLALNEKPNPL